MRRIIVRHVAIDTDGYGWEFQVTIPWVNRPTDAVQYDPVLSTGPQTPQVTVITPDDPEHWSYGENGPRFNLSTLEALLVKTKFALEAQS